MIQYVKGDATAPNMDAEGEHVIVHCCNNIGGWGSGFVLALNKRWAAPQRAYRSMDAYPLGAIQLVKVAPRLSVCNLIGQVGVGRRPDGSPPVDYAAIRTGLVALRSTFHDKTVSVHMPRMGAGLAGGKWETIEAIVNEVLEGYPVTVYDL